MGAAGGRRGGGDGGGQGGLVLEQSLDWVGSGLGLRLGLELLLLVLLMMVMMMKVLLVNEMMLLVLLLVLMLVVVVGEGSPVLPQPDLRGLRDGLKQLANPSLTLALGHQLLDGWAVLLLELVRSGTGRPLHSFLYTP